MSSVWRANLVKIWSRVAATGDLELRYPRLSVEEDHLVNYVFLPRRLMPLLHPRTPRRAWDAAMTGRAEQVLDFIRGRVVTAPPRSRTFKSALEAELLRMSQFLSL